MGFDASRFVVGDEWVYRARDAAASERVRIQAVIPKKASARIGVFFVDDPAGRVENVPGSRLRVPWSGVAAYDAVMANWRRIDDRPLDSVEEAGVEVVFDLLIPENVASVAWSPVSGATELRDRAELEAVIGLPVEEILAGIAWFELDGTLMLSPARHAADRRGRLPGALPRAVLDLVVEEEVQARHKCKHGADAINSLTGKRTFPEEEYAWYRRFDRPRHELLRQWCGHRAVSAHERLAAAEAEVQRLDVLVTELIQHLDQAGETFHARRFAEEHERDRITAYTVRPVVDRPLHPSEMPVREVPVRRRWSC
ncbi:hypothetical protein [Actinoplanes aureus]|uniref:Uncharacterized protein n=1 Tax=Actinoplanes aureus TaxID=2792083 RepID=A0A931CCC7_9ACTN|nr:hypothetical protein [Actinoplanes aureus]MBG0565382.1 hypothetical protein [Actinoplanes aureus]